MASWNVNALGMVTNVGLTVGASCAAQRAGISRRFELSSVTVLNDEHWDEPILGAPMKDIMDGFVASGSWIRLAQLGVRDLIEYGGLPGSEDTDYWSNTGLAWCFPEVTYERFLWPEEETRTILIEAGAQRLAGVLDLPLKVVPEALLPFGAVGAAAFLERADALAQAHGLQRFLLLGTDSLVDALALKLLAEKGRLGSPDNPHGLCPGEAVGAVLIESSAVPTTTCGTEARIGTAMARSLSPPFDAADVDAARVARAPELGKTLAQTVLEAAGPLLNGPGSTDVYLDLNGEPWKAHVWGHALVHLKGRVNVDLFNVIMPCITFGEIGAATPTASMCLAARSFVRGYASGQTALVLSIADSGAVSVIVMGRPA